MEHRTCLICGKSFLAKRSSQKYCPAPAGKQRGRCANRAHNARHNERIGKAALYRNEPLIISFHCQVCKKECRPGENVSSGARKFCSLRCKTDYWISATTPGGYPHCPVPRAQRKQRQWVGGRCLQCGEWFLAKLNGKGDTGYCSKDCKHREITRRRRAAIRESKVGATGCYAIAERDGFVCQLCLEPVSMDDRYPNPHAPTLDHIVPLSKGGRHREDNLQLAHAVCNSIKGNRV